MIPGWRVDDEDGLAVMRFDLLSNLGVRHGLVVKRLGQAVDGELAYRTLAARSQAVVTEQTHGTRLAEVGDGFTGFYPQRVGADGLMTDRRGAVLTIHTADCVPIFLAGPGPVALVHAGWRGTAERFAGRAVGEFCGRYGLETSRLAAVVGPAIEQSCYPVDEAVAGRFSSRAKVQTAGGKWLLDLKAENLFQLVDAGIPQASIYTSDLCTKCREELFHSYRREGDTLKGKMVAFIEAGDGES